MCLLNRCRCAVRAGHLGLRGAGSGRSDWGRSGCSPQRETINRTTAALGALIAGIFVGLIGDRPTLIGVIIAFAARRAHRSTIAAANYPREVDSCTSSSRRSTTDWQLAGRSSPCPHRAQRPVGEPGQQPSLSPGLIA
jgi:hypothetical protein